MKTYFYRLAVALAVGLAFLPLVALADDVSASATARTNRLEMLVGFTADQKAQAFEIFVAESAALNAIEGGPQDRAVKGMPIRMQSRAQIRALLTPAQQKIYDSSSQAEGGGSMSMMAAERTARLDKLVGLTADQRAEATEVFREENAAVDAIGGDLRDRALQGAPAREQSRAQIRALLTPTQRKKFDLSPQSDGGGLAVNPDVMVARIDKLLTLTADQKVQATAIIWNALTDEIAALPEDQALKGFRWQQATVDQLRAILTAAQQQIYDATPVPQGGGKVGRVAR